MTQGEQICLRCGRAGHVSASCPLVLPSAGLIVGIDPGVHTGLAIWASSEQRLVEVKSCGIVEAMAQLEAGGVAGVRLQQLVKYGHFPSEQFSYFP